MRMRDASPDPARATTRRPSNVASASHRLVAEIRHETTGGLADRRRTARVVVARGVADQNGEQLLMIAAGGSFTQYTTGLPSSG